MLALYSWEKSGVVEKGARDEKLISFGSLLRQQQHVLAGGHHRPLSCSETVEVSYQSLLLVKY